MPTRPPKPAGRIAVPRFKKRSGLLPNPQRRVLEALSTLARTEPGIDDFANFEREARALKNDRGSTILVATNVENALTHAISSRLGVDRYSPIFGYDAPLGTFSYKIRIAHALRIVGVQTRDGLDVIRSIRNAFAHSAKPMSFKTKEISDACSLLYVPDLLPPRVYKARKSVISNNRALFRASCDAIGHNLFVWALDNKYQIDPAAINVPLPGNHEIWAMLPPLP